MASPSLGRQLVTPAYRVRIEAAFVCSLSFLFFIGLALHVHGIRAEAFDQHWRALVHVSSSPLLTEFMAYTTQLGAIVALSFLSSGVILGFLFLRLKRAAALMTTNMVGAWILNDSLKLMFHRARPEPFFGIPPPGDYSFPSGHSLCSFCFYGMITALFIARIQNRAARGVIIGAAALIIAGVGLSRVYLGVHYPTDVLGGWSIALCWISFLLMFDKREEPQVSEPSEVEPVAGEATVSL
jgi:membrane-associated phospholipid phosphatase